MQAYLPRSQLLNPPLSRYIFFNNSYLRGPLTMLHKSYFKGSDITNSRKQAKNSYSKFVVHNFCNSSPQSFLKSNLITGNSKMKKKEIIMIKKPIKKEPAEKCFKELPLEKYGFRPTVLAPRPLQFIKPVGNSRFLGAK
ncbi:MAG: hypothetical protein MHMPM18_000920 [Marteilia pararefringens]